MAWSWPVGTDHEDEAAGASAVVRDRAFRMRGGRRSELSLSGQPATSVRSGGQELPAACRPRATLKRSPIVAASPRSQGWESAFRRFAKSSGGKIFRAAASRRSIRAWNWVRLISRSSLAPEQTLEINRFISFSTMSRSRRHASKSCCNVSRNDDTTASPHAHTLSELILRKAAATVQH
jgi:hypothetical protein